MNTIHLPENITEFVVQHLTRNSERGVLPFTDFKNYAKDQGLSPLNATILKLVEDYRQTLWTREQAIQEAIDKTVKQNEELLITIQNLREKSTEAKLSTLWADITENKTLMTLLADEGMSEIDFIKTLAEQLKTKTGLIYKFAIIKELETCLGELIETLLKHQVAQVNKLNHYNTAMIDPGTLTPAQIDSRIEARITLLQKQLQILEENITTYQTVKLRIKDELNQISEIIKILSVT
jgi:hypothetical protein